MYCMYCMITCSVCIVWLCESILCGYMQCMIAREYNVWWCALSDCMYCMYCMIVCIACTVCIVWLYSLCVLYDFMHCMYCIYSMYDSMHCMYCMIVWEMNLLLISHVGRQNSIVQAHICILELRFRFKLELELWNVCFLCT